MDSGHAHESRKMTDWTIIRNYNDDKLVEIIKLLNEKGKYRVV